MSRIVYDVPLVTQAQNPICWVACMAMVASYHTRTSVGVGRYANGHDPSDSCIQNLYTGDFKVYRQALARFGFVSMFSHPCAESILDLLQNRGPLILSHFCAGFPYGPGRGAISDPHAAHAIVITGIDTDNRVGLCWMNNPWGDKDQPVPISAIVLAIMKMQAADHNPIAYMR